MQAHAAGAGSPYRIESSHNDWYRAVMMCDASRVDAFLGLLISAMADEEARGEVRMASAAMLHSCCMCEWPWRMSSLRHVTPCAAHDCRDTSGCTLKMRIEL